MTLHTAELDRACGVLLGTAAGDALGAAYEFGPPRGPGVLGRHGGARSAPGTRRRGRGCGSSSKNWKATLTLSTGWTSMTAFPRVASLQAQVTFRGMTVVITSYIGGSGPVTGYTCFETNFRELSCGLFRAGSS